MKGSRRRVSAALALLAPLVGCLDVADGRARRDERIGQAAAGGVEIRVDGGLAAVRGIGAAGVALWAQAPAFELTLTLPDGTAPFELFVENALADADLSSLDPAVALTVAARSGGAPTEKTWVIAPAGARSLRLRVAPPDAQRLDPWRFAVFGDVQERIDVVQDIYRRMNAEPGVRFVVMCGDLTPQGAAGQLERFQREMKTLAFPIYATLGNHELGVRDDLFHEYFGRGSFSFVFRGVRFTLLDSASATLAPAVYGWLETWLEEAVALPHFAFMHIPPLDPTGTRGGAFASRLEANRLLALLAAGRVDMTLYGHVHSYYAFTNAGIPAYISGGGGAIPEQFDGIGRHFLVVDVDPVAQRSEAGLVRVD